MPEVSHYEPRQALDGGPDGLDAYRAIGAAALKLLAPGGHLLVEVGRGQASDVAAIFGSQSLSPGIPRKDLGGIERVVGARH
jgi:release factor glutamine methyltransferase